ncbi:MAG: hypothetical protein KGI26_01605 [Thaumarchaeota archaeon]|nr:hypothetical protein [Nitrososphaerota archaeon]
MFYEERVTSQAELKRRVRALDQDAGVRLIAGSGRHRYLMFVTRFGRKYTVMTYSMGRSGAPGKRLQTTEYDDLGVVERILTALDRPLRAWVY